MMKYLRALLVFLLALVLAGFIQQNSQSIILKYFGYNTTALPLSLFMIVAFALGYLLAICVGFSGTVRSKFRLMRVEKEVKRLKNESTQDHEKKKDAVSGSAEDDPDYETQQLPAGKADEEESGTRRDV